MMEREGFLRVKEAAALLDVAPNTVRAWGAAGKIPEYRHPANNYKRQDLEKILVSARRPRKPANREVADRGEQ